MRSLILFLWIACPLFVHAQANKNLGLLTGNVLHAETGKALQGASIEVFVCGDSMAIRHALADKNGAFEIDKLPFHFYRLQISAVGMTNLIIDSIHLRPERYDFNLGDLKLKPKQNELAEVMVYAEKPLIENKDGKIIYNVGESALSAGASTNDLLKQMPLVSNDANGKILLKGKEPKILIDDKPVELNSQQLADLLESLPGGSIDKIELMLNPPPQFATEQVGVINIVTKKGKIGLNGRLSLSAGSRGEASLQTNLNYRTGKWVLNGNVGISGSQLNGSNYSRRSNFYIDSTNYFNTDGRFDNQSFRPNLRLQADFEASKFSSFSGTLQTNYNQSNNESYTAYGNLNRNQTLWRLSDRNNQSRGYNFNLQAQFGYKLKTKKTGEQLSLLATYSLGDNESNRNFLQQFLLPNNMQVLSDSTMRQNFNTQSNNYSLRADYSLPLKWQRAVLSLGATFNSNQFHNVLGSANLRKTDNLFVPNLLLSNDFLFYQQIATMRAGISFQLDSSWKLIIGAQAEHTNTDFNFGNSNNNYWNVLPNATLRKDFSKTINASIVYRATIRRPGIIELNPSVDYNDPFNLRFGNPVLSPSLADNWDLNMSYIQTKWYVNFGLGFNALKDIFSSIRSLQADGKTYITYQNISNRKEYEATVWGGITLNKKFRLNASAGYTFNEYSSIEQQLYKYRNGGTFYTTFNYNLTITDETSVDGNARYSNFADPQGNSRSNVSTNIGVQQKFFNKRFIVSFNIIDPFTPQQLSTFTYGTNFNLENYNSTNTKNFRITLTYQLNQVRKAKLQKTPRPEKQKSIIEE